LTSCGPSFSLDVCLADNKLVRDKIKGLENKYDELFQQVFAVLKQMMKDEDKPTRQIGFLSE